MFCMRCGHENKAGARFCTNCGAPLSGDSDATAVVPPPSETEGPNPSSEEVPAQTKAHPTGRRRLIIGVAAIALIALAAVVAVAVLGGFGDDAVTVAFGSDESVSITRTARIVPTTSDGTPLEHYSVRVVRATDGNGEEIDLSDEPQSVKVSGTGGFTMESIVPNHETGTYLLEIDDGSEVLTTPPLVLDDENGCSGEVHIEPPTSSGGTSGDDAGTDDADAVRGADALFLEKVEELQDEYGEPTLEVTGDADAYCASIRGLAYAELVDFGDGEERLVAMWNDSEEGYDGPTSVLWQETPSSLAGTVEVWEYDEDADELVTMLNDGDGVEFFGMMFDYYENSGEDTALYIKSFEVDTSSSSLTETLYGVDSSGEFGMIWEGTSSSSGSDTTFFVNGESVDDEEFVAAREKMFAADSGYSSIESVYVYFVNPNRDEALNGYANSTRDDLYPAATVQTVPDTTALLEKRLSAAVDGTATDNDNANADAAADVTAE